MDKTIKNAFKGVEGRISEIEFFLSAQNHYELIADTLQKEEPKFSHMYQNVIQNCVYGEVVKKSYELSCFEKVFSKTEYMQIVAKGCFPLLPLTAYALLAISEKVAQNERTVFTFLAQKSQGSLPWILEKGETQCIGVDRVYDYFKNLFRDSAEYQDIHNEWMKVEYAISKTDIPTEQKTLKALGVIRMIHRGEELPAKEEVLRLSLGYEKELFSEIMQALMEKNLIFYRSSQGVYAFRANVGVDVESVIQKQMDALEHKFQLCKTLSEISEFDYELPKRYNQTFCMTRYFQYEMMSLSDFLKVQNSQYLFEEKFADGKILLLFLEEQEEETKITLELVQTHLKELNDDRLLVFFPKKTFCVKKLALKYEAVTHLKKDKKFMEDNAVLLQELNLYAEDLIFEINAIAESVFLPQNAIVLGMRAEPIFCKNASDWNDYLSVVCESYYGCSPKVNHELLNVQKIGTQYKKARDKVVKCMLEGNDVTPYLKGTNPEALVYRAAFVHTKGDVGCEQLCGQIKTYFAQCAGNRQSFGRLYDCLQGKGLGARKGIIPLFLAQKLANTEGTAVISLKKKELHITAETLNNVNDFPEQYELYIEPETAEKDWYLSALEQLFCGKEDFSLSKQGQMQTIVEKMQRWYRSLPQYAILTKRYSLDCMDMVKTLCSQLKRAEVNPHELLFEKIFESVSQQTLVLEKEQEEESLYETVIKTLQKTIAQMDGKLKQLCDRLNVWIKKEFDAKETENLKACLKGWYQNQSHTAKVSVLNTSSSRVLTYIKQLKENDEEEIVHTLAHLVMDVYLEDWNDDLTDRFCEMLHDIKVQVEQISDVQTKRFQGMEKSRFILQDAQGKEIMKYFDADVTDSTSIYLKNAIEDAIDEFGDTLELNQKVAVLVQILSRLSDSSGQL